MHTNGNVALTALAVALCRAHESDRPDALFNDWLAQPLVDAFGPELQELFDFGEATTAALYANIAGRTAYFDEAIGAALSDADQVVLLGAGLDTRFERHPAADAAHWWEVDTTELLDIKDPFLAQHVAAALERRTSVRADLAGDWPSALAAAGHRSDKPTIWLIEGVFSYLTPAQNDVLVDTVTQLSPAGSTLAATHWGPGKALDQYGRALQAATEQHGVAFQSWIQDPVSWLDGFGWGAHPTTLATQARRFGRSTESVEEPGREVGWLITAGRRG